MTVTLNEVAEFMGELLSEVGGDPDKIESMIFDRLGQYGFDPVGITTMAQTIVHLAVQQNEAPEPTIIAAFQMGVVLGAAKGERP